MQIVAWLSALWKNLTERGLRERELDNELRTTLDLLVDERIAAGMHPIEARRAAMVDLGGIESVREQVRDVRAGAVIETILQDFMRFSDTELGIAIGDVSGKGISASLLMATLRAYLRGQTALGEADLCRLMSNLNRFVHESSATERYATFFYGRYDSSTRELTYVNGGHNPPLLFRGTDGSARVVRLETGGPVIGLLPDCSYEQGRVGLEAGDVLVAFTDGISEARNAAELEWGEERLTAAIQSNRALAARDLIRHIMAEADGHVAAAPQHDDMTLVVLRFG